MSSLIKVSQAAASWLIAAEARSLRLYKVDPRLISLQTQMELEEDICVICSLGESGLWFVVTRSHEWAAVTVDFEVVASGAFPTATQVTPCPAVVWSHETRAYVLIAWNCWQLSLVVVSLKHRPPKVKTHQLSANERLHWPLAEVRGLCCLKGPKAQDYAVRSRQGRPMFAVLFAYAEGLAVYTFSVNTILNQIEKGPWSVPAVMSCQEMFSVQDKLFLLCRDHVLQVNLDLFTVKTT
jgi:hypothetical protein